LLKEKGQEGKILKCKEYIYRDAQNCVIYQTKGRCGHLGKTSKLIQGGRLIMYESMTGKHSFISQLLEAGS
jgi:hypothetical protein